MSAHHGKGSDDATEVPEEVRDKFREALERKRNQHHGSDGAPRNPVEGHPHTAPAKPQRTFRRKSG